MTPQEKEAVGGLIESLEKAANLIDVLSRTLLTVLDGGGRELLVKEEAADLDEQIGNAGVLSASFRSLAALSRTAMLGDQEGR